MRAALLPTPGDPFVVAYWLRNLERVWRPDVGGLDVLVNGQGDPEAIAFIRGEVERLGGTVTVEHGRMSQGAALRTLVERSYADYVLLMEDDAYVRWPGAVADAFERLEAGVVDVIATPRAGMDPAIETAARARWATEVASCGSEGPGMWPCFLFAPLAALKATSRRFEARSWRPGDVIPGLDYLVEGREQTTDVFTAAAFELRAAGLRIEPGPQYKELWQKDLPAGGAPWFHAGGLSNGDFLTPAWDGGGARPGVGGSNEGLDWAHRIWWWRRCLDTAGDKVLPHRQAEYRARLNALVELLGVAEQVAAWDEKLLPWLCWDDQA